MIKNSFLFISIISLFYGAIFFIIPDWFVNFTMAENINIAWLRSIGASIIGVLFLGCFFIYLNPKDKKHLLRIITFTSLFQTLGLIYSRYFNEFSAKNIVIIDITIIIAVLVTIYFVLLIFYKAEKFN